MTLNVLVTLGAAEYVAFPGCEAVIEHVPTATGVTREPLTVQILGELLWKFTDRFDDALPLRFCGSSISFIFAGWVNERVCANPSIVKVLVTSVAGEYSPFPD